MTHDEHLLLEVYRHLQKKKSEDATVDAFAIGKKLGYKDHHIENILRGLIKANLLKRYGHNEVTLTPRGRESIKEIN